MLYKKSLLVTKFQNKTSFYTNFQELTKNIEGSSILFIFHFHYFVGFALIGKDIVVFRFIIEYIVA